MDRRRGWNACRWPGACSVGRDIRDRDGDIVLDGAPRVLLRLGYALPQFPQGLPLGAALGDDPVKCQARLDRLPEQVFQGRSQSARG